MTRPAKVRFDLSGVRELAPAMPKPQLAQLCHRWTWTQLLKHVTATLNCPSQLFCHWKYATRLTAVMYNMQADHTSGRHAGHWFIMSIWARGISECNQAYCWGACNGSGWQPGTKQWRVLTKWLACKCSTGPSFRISWSLAQDDTRKGQANVTPWQQDWQNTAGQRPAEHSTPTGPAPSVLLRTEPVSSLTCVHMALQWHNLYIVQHAAEVCTHQHCTYVERTMRGVYCYQQYIQQ